MDSIGNNPGIIQALFKSSLIFFPTKMNPLEGISSVASHEAEKLLDRYVNWFAAQLITVGVDGIG